MEQVEDPTVYEIASILGAVLNKVGPTVLTEEDFNFGDTEQEIILVPNEGGTVTVALGVSEAE